MDPRTRELIKLSAASVIVNEIARAQVAQPNIQKQAGVNKKLIALLALLGLGGAGAAMASGGYPGVESAKTPDSPRQHVSERKKDMLDTVAKRPIHDPLGLGRQIADYWGQRYL